MNNLQSAVCICIGDRRLVSAQLEGNVPQPADMSKQQSKAAALQKRMTDFAAEIIKLASELPQIQAAKHVAGQLLRSGTATAANYAEARSAESLSDFIHKLRIVLKELNETEVWLELITKSSWLYPERIIAIVAENRELCCIIAKSIQTARRLPAVTTGRSPIGDHQ